MVLSADEDLVHADALMQAGDPRGELIVVEISLARDPHPALRKRRAELRAQHARRWWPELPLHRLHTRGGYVRRIVATADELDRATPLARRERVDEIVLLDDALHIADAWRAHLHHLTLVSDGGGGIVELLDWPITSFALRDAFAASGDWSLGGALPACTHLDFAGQTLYDAAARILDWDHIGRLESLDLSGCRIDAMTLDVILASGLPRLRTLRLAGNRLGDGARPILAKHLPNLPALARLELAASGIPDDDLATITTLARDVDVIGSYRRPARFAIEVGAKHVELVAGDGDAWEVEVDGRPIDIHLSRSRRYDRETIPDSSTRGRLAAIEDVVHALVIGQPLMPQLDGTATLALGSQLGAVYNTSVYTSTTAKLAITDVAAEIQIEEYVSID